MAIDSISSVSPIMSQSAMVRPSRPRESTPTESAAAAQQDDARLQAAASSGASPAYQAGPAQNANPSVVGTRMEVTPVANNAEASLQEANAQISRASQAPAQTSVDQRTASQAYTVQAQARDQVAQQQQGNGTRTLDVMA